jgi:flagellar assembly protein FliH
MPLLKASTAQQTRQSCIVMDLSDLEHEATQIVSKARAEADRILADARQSAGREATQIREEARAAGHAEGLQAGLAEGQKTGHDAALANTTPILNDLTARWSQALEILHQHMPAHAADARTDLVRLALAIAARVTHQEALKNKHVAESVVADALALAATSRTVSLHINPDEEPTLVAYLPALLEKLRTTASVALVPDPEVTPGGVITHFGHGQIDARLETQLARIADELLASE